MTRGLWALQSKGANTFSKTPLLLVTIDSRQEFGTDSHSRTTAKSNLLLDSSGGNRVCGFFRPNLLGLEAATVLVLTLEGKREGRRTGGRGPPTHAGSDHHLAPKNRFAGGKPPFSSASPSLQGDLPCQGVQQPQDVWCPWHLDSGNTDHSIVCYTLRSGAPLCPTVSTATCPTHSCPSSL